MCSVGFNMDDCELLNIHRIYAGEYFLQAGIFSGCVLWTEREFKYYEKKFVVHSDIRPLHMFYVTCRVKPSPYVAVLLTSCRTEADLKALFRSSEWRYMTLAYSMAVLQIKPVEKLPDIKNRQRVYIKPNPRK